MLEGRGLARVAKELISHVRQSAKFSRTALAEIPGNRLGGRPNLPDHIEWPQWRDQPLAFIAQLDMAALPRIEGLGLPPSGALYFFYEGGGEAWGFTPDDRGAWQVYYSEGEPAGNPLRNFPSR